MGKLLYRLNGADEQEAQEVRDLLTEHQVDFYETHAGRWKLSVAAVWLKNEQDFDRARALLDDYQIARQQRVRTEFQQQLANGEIPTLWQRIQERPVDHLMIAAAIVFLVGIMLWPFFKLSQ